MGGEHVQVKGFTERGPNPQSEIRNPKSNDPIGFAGPDHPAAAPQNLLSRRSRLISLECAPEKRSFSANPGAGGATHLGFWILDCGFLGLWASALGLTIANRKSQIENGMGAGGATLTFMDELTPEPGSIAPAIGHAYFVRVSAWTGTTKTVAPGRGDRRVPVLSDYGACRDG